MCSDHDAARDDARVARHDPRFPAAAIDIDRAALDRVAHVGFPRAIDRLDQHVAVGQLREPDRFLA
jgi:hypothetical protein